MITSNKEEVPMILGEHIEGLGWEIKCAGCGDTNTHHFDVEIWTRDEEDSETGLHVQMLGGTVGVDSSMSNCPSIRCDGFVFFM